LSLLEASLIFLWISSMDAVFAVCGWYIELIYSLLPDGNVSFAQIISAVLLGSSASSLSKVFLIATKTPP
jgi:hypothetical protein